MVNYLMMPYAKNNQDPTPGSPTLGLNFSSRASMFDSCPYCFVAYSGGGVVGRAQDSLHSKTSRLDEEDPIRSGSVCCYTAALAVSGLSFCSYAQISRVL
ncbi:hypothetical protein PoB_000976400 [Plakobranchus ocellatus]|uniref:Uncharacterized protein n=1 Tax=Plakobranchus ocellatus TaxID=259542 RepID=A0AAV3YMH6_9GAST|nr:hypothetical protein PoB_000976400 [Plakobranchus ocellatus]